MAIIQPADDLETAGAVEYLLTHKGPAYLRTTRQKLDRVNKPDGYKFQFGTEASLFHAAAIPAIICGPGHIAQAHQPNEWVSVEQLARCEAFMRRLADRVCVA